MGDIILSVAGEPTAQVEDLLSAVEQRRIGDAVEVEIYRGAGTPSAEELSVRVQLEERQADIAGGGGGGGGGRGGPTDVHQRRRSRM